MSLTKGQGQAVLTFLLTGQPVRCGDVLFRRGSNIIIIIIIKSERHDNVIV